MNGFTNIYTYGNVCYLIDSCFQQACVSCNNDTCTMCLLGYSLMPSGECIKCPASCV